MTGIKIMQNLNELLIEQDAWGELAQIPEQVNQKRKQPLTDGDVTVFFDDIEASLCEIISRYSFAVGCVAWLTSENILKALAALDRVSIIVQKEDFLRPDSPSFSSKKLYGLYKALPEGVKGTVDTDEYWGDVVGRLNFNCPWESGPVRWCGQFNRDRKPHHPRMHHKFLVLGDLDNGYEFNSKAVWTGSFNFTFNSSRSLENALLITKPTIVKAYYDEWQRTFALSENIPGYAWDNEWEPEDFRIGT